MSPFEIKSFQDRISLLHPNKMDLSLDRVSLLLGKLGNPEKKIKNIIHVAGTNGKGSVIAYLSSILLAAGYTVDTYTSPHLVSFNERIKIGGSGSGSFIDDDSLDTLLKDCEKVNAGDPITIFEIITAAAFLKFSQTNSDFLLLETGLGGRLDATNVIESPLISIITPIGIDHQQFLGNTIEKIASEKAGIIKKGVPVVISKQVTNVNSILEEVAKRSLSDVIKWGENFQGYTLDDCFVYEYRDLILKLDLPNLDGEHQIINASTAIAACHHIDGLSISEKDYSLGMTNVCWPGRLELLKRGFLNNLLNSNTELWLDGGHNEHAAEAISKTMRHKSKDGRPLIIIIAMLKTKDSANFLRPFANICNELIAIKIPNQKNSEDPEKIQVNASRLGINSIICDSLFDALKNTKKYTKPTRILVCGSLYLAGYALLEQRGIAF
tara:strand:+ start:2068 stop:3384 length:1317 start_codon:yes stop_codon:yes gene_type:complete